MHTDWDFLLPQVVNDEDLADIHMTTPGQPINIVAVNEVQQSLPVIAGFVALIRVFLCVVDLLSKGFPGSPPQAYAMTAALSHGDESQPSRSTVSLGALLRIVKQLQTTLEELPEELKISTLDPHLRPAAVQSATSDLTAHQFDTMRANIHITSLYIQSTILEACSHSFNDSSLDAIGTSPADQNSPRYTPRTQLWKFRESIARELLEVLNFCSSRTLEANGSSMVRILDLCDVPPANPRF